MNNKKLPLEDPQEPIKVHIAIYSGTSGTSLFSCDNGYSGYSGRSGYSVCYLNHICGVSSKMKE